MRKEVAMSRNSIFSNASAYARLGIRLLAVVLLTACYGVFVSGIFRYDDMGEGFVVVVGILAFTLLAVGTSISLIHYLLKGSHSRSVWWIIYPYVSHGSQWFGIVLMVSFGRTSYWWLLAPLAGLLPAFVSTMILFRN